jgi:hypothetical protein
VVAQEELLAEQLDTSIVQYTRTNAVVRRAFWSARIGVMALGAASTVLLGLRIDDPHYADMSRNLALGFSALTTFLTGLGTFWNLENYWVRRKAVEHQLLLLKQRFEFRRKTADGMPEAELDQFFAEYLAILGKLSEYWASQVNQGSAEQAGSQPGRNARVQYDDLPAHPDDERSIGGGGHSV